MKGAEPGHAFASRSDERSDSLLHLPRCLVGERHRKDLVRARSTCRDHMGDACRQHTRFPGASASEDQDRAIDRFDGPSLFRIQPDEIGSGQLRPGAICDAARARQGRHERGSGFGQFDAPGIRQCCRFVSDKAEQKQNV